MGNSTLTIIAHPDIFILQQKENRLAEEQKCLSLGKALSDFLIKEDTHYSMNIAKWIEDTLQAKSPGPIICTDIDILFLPSLGLDPLTIFRQISRFTSLIVFWPGTYKDGVLSYAQPEHQHYHSWKNLDGIEVKGVSDAL